MGYTHKSTITIKLGDFGTDCNGNDFYIEIKNPRLLTYGDREKLTEMLDGSKADVFISSLTGMVVSTNLEDVETGEPLKITDPDFIFKIPRDIVTLISEKCKPDEKHEEKTKN